MRCGMCNVECTSGMSSEDNICWLCLSVRVVSGEILHVHRPRDVISVKGRCVEMRRYGPRRTLHESRCVIPNGHLNT